MKRSIRSNDLMELEKSIVGIKRTIHHSMTPEPIVLETNSEHKYIRNSFDDTASYHPARVCSISPSSSSTLSSSASTSSIVSDGDTDDDVIEKKSHILNIVDSFSKLFEDYLDIHTDIRINRDIDLVKVSDNSIVCTYDNNNNNNYKSARMNNNYNPTDTYVNFSEKDYSSNTKLSFALGSFVKINHHHHHMKKTRVSMNIVKHNMQLLDIQ